MSIPSQGHPITEAPLDFWFINSLITFIADAAATESAFSLCRQVAPSGFATPYHMHEAYGEGFYVLDGKVTFFLDGKKTVLGRGGFIYLPEPSRMASSSAVKAPPQC